MKRNVATLLAVASAAGAYACAGVGRYGMPVVFGDQTNIVIWDSKHHVEHFIRAASFKTRAKDFGFIAPSPNKPDLASGSVEAFETLAALGPRVYEPSGAAGMTRAMAPAAQPKVRVIQQVNVSGYKATTLLATDSGALASWMSANGYQTTPGIQKWTQPYIAKGWYLTAFKVNGASSGTVRMSFKTYKPFNPYYVPDDNIQAGNRGTLRIYFVADREYSATIGTDQPWLNRSWLASVPSGAANELAKQLQLRPSQIPDSAIVEQFQDFQFPRRVADDLYFIPKKFAFALPRHPGLMRKMFVPYRTL